MPTIRATVTTADATPYSALAGGLDGCGRSRRDRQTEPQPEPGEREGHVLRSMSPASRRTWPATRRWRGASPTTVTRRRPVRRTRKPETRAPTAVAPASAPRARRCSIRSAVQHPVDEHRAPDDRRGERIAGQQRDQRCGTERQAPEQPRLDERVRRAQSDQDERAPLRPTEIVARAIVTVVGSRPVSAISVVPIRVSPTRPVSRASPNSAAPTRSTRPLRRGVSQPGATAQARTSAMIADRDVDVEDPAPGRRHEVGQGPVGQIPHPPARPRHGPTTGSPRRRTARRPCRGTSAPR